MFLFNDLADKNNFLRQQREPLLAAWDIFSKNYMIGIDDVSAGRFQEVVNWYKLIKDLDYDAIANPPQEIVKYIKI